MMRSIQVIPIRLALGCLTVVFGLCLCATQATAQDVASARKHYRTCKQLVAEGDPCGALVACDNGLAAAPSAALESLRKTAFDRCSETKGTTKVRKIRDKDKDGIADREDKCPDEAEDVDGFEDQDGCPDLDNDQDLVLDDVDKCPFDREDLDGFEDEDGCADDDNDNDGLLDAKDKCPNDTEDLDGFEDEDGCPELDNDKDGIADLDDKCPMDAEDLDSVEDGDGCPELDNDNDGLKDAVDKCPNDTEDLDGFEDEDGCPDVDNDGDGIADALDACPNVAEDDDDYLDLDGCPENNTLVIAGWSLAGVGVAAIGGGLGLHFVAEADRDAARVPDADGVIRAVKQTEVGEVEQSANELDTIGAIVMGGGGAFVAAGATMILIAYLRDDDGQEAQTSSGPVPDLGLAVLPGGAHATFGWRF